MLKELSVAEQRCQAVLAVLEDGLTVTEAAAKSGVSRQTMHAGLARYAGGLERLADRSHRPVLTDNGQGQGRGWGLDERGSYGRTSGPQQQQARRPATVATAETERSLTL